MIHNFRLKIIFIVCFIYFLFIVYFVFSLKCMKQVIWKDIFSLCVAEHSDTFFYTVKGVMVVMFSQKMLEAVLNDQLNFSTRMEVLFFRFNHIPRTGWSCFTHQ